MRIVGRRGRVGVGERAGEGQRAPFLHNRYCFYEEWYGDTWVEDSTEQKRHPLRAWGYGAHLYYGHTPTDRHKLRDAYTCSWLLAYFSSLLASLLTCWLLSTTASVTIQSPKHVVEGENILLQVDNLPENLLAFAWYRGLTNWRLTIAVYLLDYSTSMTGPEHSDREILYSNGSLWIQNVTQEDTGYYIFQTISNHGELESNTSTFLQVYCK